MTVLPFPAAVPDPEPTVLTPAELDRRTLDNIALFLAASPTWDEAVADQIANLVALARPFPAGRTDDLAEYAAELLARTPDPTDTDSKENHR